MPQAASPALASPATPLLALAAVFLASAALCTLGYLALAAPGSWFGAARTLHWSTKELAVTHGSALRTREGLVITAPDAMRTVVIAVNTSFRSRDYALIAWDAAGVPDDVQATLVWSSDYVPSRMLRRTLTVEAGRITPAFVAEDRDWLGGISGLALVLQGSFSEPIVIRGAAAKPMSAGQVLGDRLEEWLAFEQWNGNSINMLTGGADTQDLPLPALLAAIAAMAALAYAGFARWKFHFSGPVLGAGVAALFVIAWVVIDARWQWNLLRQAQVTQAQYAGKSWRDRHLAAEDGPVFAFIEKVRAKLPAPPARVFMVADAHYFRDRGAYHLYPYNVYFDPWTNSMPPASAVRSGDYLVVYQRRGVQYDASQQRLRWEDSAPIDAELLLFDSGAALFRIR